jgi:DinB superfamily
MEHELDNTLALLERTPAALDALLRGLPGMWTEGNEGGNTWSATMVITHLVHCEHENWMPRAKVILQSGEAKPFAPFDRGGLARLSQGKTLEQLLEEFADARANRLQELRALRLTPEDLQRKGKHPTFGAVTLSQLLATWAAHDLTHLHQISRIMAYQYREAVGPWSKFLGVMHCAGHSEQA